MKILELETNIYNKYQYTHVDTLIFIDKKQKTALFFECSYLVL